MVVIGQSFIIVKKQPILPLNKKITIQIVSSASPSRTSNLKPKGGSSSQSASAVVHHTYGLPKSSISSSTLVSSGI